MCDAVWSRSNRASEISVIMFNCLINTAVYNVLKVSDKGAISHARHFLGLRDNDVLYEERGEKFLTLNRTECWRS